MKKGYQPILDYVEGRISAEEFQNFFMTKSEVKNVLKQPMSAEYAYLKDYGWSMYKYLQCKFGGYNKNWNTIRNRRRIQIVLSQFLNNFNIQHTQYPKYREESDFILDICVEQRKIVWITLKDDTSISIPIQGRFRRNEIIGLIYEVRAQIKGYEQQYI